jgi:PAS domain S-box-containing protein
MKQNWILITSTGLLLILVSLLTFNLHGENTEAILSQFQQRQLSYAKHFSNQIRFFIQARSRGLIALSGFPSVQDGDIKQQRADLQAYARDRERIYVKAIYLYDERGRFAFSTDPETVGHDGHESPFFIWARRKENKGKIFLSPIVSGSQSLTFVLGLPIYQDVSNHRSSPPSGKFIGALTFTLDLKAFLADQLSSVDPRISLDQVWIIDQDGTLLFHHQHPEMMSWNIHQEDGNCRQCHPSFEYAEQVLRKRQGTVEYQLRNRIKQVGAFAPMEIEDASWVVVVNTSYAEVTGFMKKSLREHLFLLGIVVLAFAFGSALLLRKERMKVKAEEEVMRWQERMMERQKAEEALERERNKLKGILDSMKDGVYIVNQENEIQYINPVIEKKFGPVNGRKCHEYFNEFPTACSWCKNKEVFTGKTIHWEWHSSRTGGTYDLIDTPLLGPDGGLCKLQIIRDMSGRKRAEQALRQSEKRYRMLVETMNDGLGVQNEHGTWVYVNDRLCEMLGYSRDEMIGRPLTDFLSETDQRVYKEQVARRRRGERESYELPWLKKDGKKIITLVSPKPILDERGQFKGSFAVVTGITERKQAEDALKESETQLRALSSQLMTAQETERKRISRELHDELGQALTVIKLRFDFVEKNLLKDQADVKQECEYGLQYIDQVIEDVRRLSRDLSPSILEDFGLSAALRWLINNFAKSYKTKVVLEMTDIDSLLPHETHVAVYRTLQEALTNIGKHSRAKKVSVAIHEHDGSVLFAIEDDGIGFDMEEATRRNPAEKGLGLETMKGRAQMAGGVLRVQATQGKGTLITLSIPKKQGATS